MSPISTIDQMKQPLLSDSSHNVEIGLGLEPSSRLSTKEKDGHTYKSIQPTDDLSYNLEVDTSLDPTLPLSPKKNAEQTYQVFCKMAKDWYIKYAENNPSNLQKSDIRNSSNKTEREWKIIKENTKDFSQLKSLIESDYKIMSQHRAYQKALRAFNEFQQSADDKIRNEVISSSQDEFIKMRRAFQPELQPTSRSSIGSTQPRTPKSSFEIANIQLKLKTAELELDAAQLFNHLVSNSTSNTKELELERSASVTYDHFSRQNSKVEQLKSSKRSSLIQQFKDFFVKS